MISAPYGSYKRRTPSGPVLAISAVPTVTRAGEACYYTSAPTTGAAFLAWAGANTSREDKRDGLSGYYLYETASTNRVFYSEDFNQASWSKTTTTVPNTTGAAPDGESDCCRVSFTAAATSKIYRTVAGIGNSQTFSITFFVKTYSGGSNVRVYTKDKDATARQTSDISISSTWKRIELVMTTSASGAGTFEVGVQNGTAGASTAILLWGAQVELGSFPTSPIRTTTAAAGRNTDVVTVPSTDSVSLNRLLYGDLTVKVAPTCSSSEASTNDQGVIGLPGGNSLIRIQPGKIQSVWGLQYNSLTTLYEKDSLTWSRDQVLTVKADHVAGQMTVTGATTGDGTGSVGTTGGLPRYMGMTPRGLSMNTGLYLNARVHKDIYTSSNSTVSESICPPYLCGGLISSYSLTRDNFYIGAPNTTGGFLQPNDNSSLPNVGLDARDGDTTYMSVGVLNSYNYVLYSQAFDNAAWTKTLCSIGAGTTASPVAGSTTCKTVSFTADATAALTADLAGLTTNNSKVLCSLWARHAAGASNIRLSFKDEAGTITTSSDLAISATWTRVYLYISDTGTAGGTQVMGIQNSTAGAAQDVEIWGAQAEILVGSNDIIPGCASLATVGTAVALPLRVYSIDLDNSTLKAGLKAGTWTFKVHCLASSTDAPTGGMLFWIDATHYFKLEPGANSIHYYEGSGIKFSGPSLSFAKDDILTVVVDLPNGRVSINGSWGSTTTATTLSGTMYFGQTSGGASPVKHRFTLPY